MKRRFHRYAINRAPRQVRTVPALGTCGHNDAKHFDRAEVVTLTFGRSDLDTIAAALVAANAPDTLSLLRRIGIPADALRCS